MTDQHDDHLAAAQRHVSEGEQRVAHQQALIQQLAADGHDTTAAETFLRTLQETLGVMRQHLQQILDERAGQAE